jgi:EAL and modified HD-GYP domain-containing signal transduction protein
MPQENILLARQPIYDINLNIYAYELLFRADSHQQSYKEIGADAATSTVIFNAFSEVGIHNVVGEHRAFINFTRNLILDPPPFTSGEIVIEVLEDVEPEPEILASLQQFKQQGYTIALDDFKYHKSLQPLVDLADIIKIDVLDLTRDELIAHAAMLQNDHLKLLAEKVESQEMYDFCKSLGFSFFQGYFLSRPKAVKGRKVPADKLVVMRLLSDLQTPDITPQELNETISKDAALSFKLLRMVNSAAYRRPNKIESLYRAILLIGLKDIKHWASLLALSSLDDKPHALAELTMTRAKMCELIGTYIHSGQSDLFYTVGMFSMLDAYFDTPLEALLESMSFTDEINDALLKHEGVLGFVLKTAIAYENGNWGEIDWQGLSRYGLSIADIKEAYLESLQWYEERGQNVLSEGFGKPNE